MKKFFLGLFCFSLICSSAVYAGSDRYIVTFKSNALKNAERSDVLKEMKKDALQSEASLKSFVKKNDKASVLWIINGVALNLSDEDVANVKKLPNFKYIEKVETLQLQMPVSSKSATPKEGNQWGLKKIDTAKVWNELNINGSGIVVGQLDSGVTPAHPALAGQIIKFKDFIEDGDNDDGIGHGTHTAGTILGTKNGIGVAPGAKLIVGKIFGNGGSTTSEAIAKGMQWMMDPDGNPDTDDAPLAVNNSWGSNDSTSQTFWDEVTAWRKVGIIPVFSAGNNGYYGGKVGTPAAYPHSFAIGSTTENDGCSAFSSKGPVVWDGNTLVKPDVSAPGSNVISASHTSDGYTSKSGTSMASPHVTGVIALMFQANPALKDKEVEKILEETSKDLDAEGKDNKFGHGRVNAFEAVSKVISVSDPVEVIEAANKILESEHSYCDDARQAPLSGEYISSLVKRYSSLDNGEYLNMSIKIMQSGSPLAKKILAEIATVRKFNNVHTDK